MKKKYINIIIGLMAIGGGFAAANLRQWSINNIANSSTCLNILGSSLKTNEKPKLEKNLELSNNELIFYDNFQRNCQLSIKKESKEGFWETFIMYSVISLIGLNIARALKE
jgi:hypothetical protein